MLAFVQGDAARRDLLSLEFNAAEYKQGNGHLRSPMASTVKYSWDTAYADLAGTIHTFKS